MNTRRAAEDSASKRGKKKVDYMESGDNDDDDDVTEAKSPTKNRKQDINIKQYLKMTDEHY